MVSKPPTIGFFSTPDFSDYIRVPARSLSYSAPGVSSPHGDDPTFPLGSFSFLTDIPNIRYRFNLSATLNDPFYEGTVRSVSTSSAGGYSVVADCGKVSDNDDLVLPPVSVGASGDTLAGYYDVGLWEYMSDAGPIAVPSWLPGWVGNGRERLANMAQAYGLIAKNNDPQSTYLDPAPDTLNANGNPSAWEAPIERGEPCQFIEVIYYEGGHVTSGEIYPGEDPEPQIIQVEARETVETTFQLNAWLISVNQPECVDWVEADPDYYDGTDGVYSVSGRDNRPITAAQWIDQGGSVEVRIDPLDPKSIIVRVTGMRDGTYGPFRIAMTSTVFYPSLRITGDAVIANPRTVRIPTGADDSLTSVEVGATIDNPFLQTRAQALTVGARAARKYCGITQSMSGVGEGYQPADLLEYDYARYFVRSVSGDHTPTVSWTAEYFTRMSDFEEVWTPADTMADFETQWTDATMGQYMLTPLRRD